MGLYGIARELRGKSLGFLFWGVVGEVCGHCGESAGELAGTCGEIVGDLW